MSKRPKIIFAIGKEPKFSTRYHRAKPTNAKSRKQIRRLIILQGEWLPKNN
jgi:hypothetical protein